MHPQAQAPHFSRKALLFCGKRAASQSTQQGEQNTLRPAPPVQGIRARCNALGFLHLPTNGLFAGRNKGFIRSIIEKHPDFLNFPGGFVYFFRIHAGSRLAPARMDALAPGGKGSSLPLDILRSHVKRIVEKQRRLSRCSIRHSFSTWRKYTGRGIRRLSVSLRRTATGKHFAFAEKQPIDIHLWKCPMHSLHVVVRRIGPASKYARQRSRGNTEFRRKILLRHLRMLHDLADSLFHKFVFIVFVFVSILT